MNKSWLVGVVLLVVGIGAVTTMMFMKQPESYGESKQTAEENVPGKVARDTQPARGESQPDGSAPLLLAQAADGKTLIKGTGWGKLTGKVIYDPAKPLPMLANVAVKMADHTDKACCLAGLPGETQDQTWFIDPKTRGVANVVVWLKAGPKEYFDIQPQDRVRKGQVVIDQPHCAFVPHVSAVYPEYFDGKAAVKTGETLLIKNSSIVTHNANMSSPDPLKNQSVNFVIPPGGQQAHSVNPMRPPFKIECGIHQWMNAWLYVFDHPYYAITKDDGTFEIPNVPAGVEVSVMSWHEAVGYVEGGKEGTKKTFKAGANTYDMKVAE